LTFEAGKMPGEHYQSLADLEDVYWWHQTRYRMACALIERHSGPLAGLRMADIGCGTGGFLRYVRRLGAGHPIGFDSSEAALRHLEQFGLIGHRVELEHAFTLPEAPYDVITALDVMEHVENEHSFLDSVRENLRDRGILLLTVPAHQYLFSQWDRRLHHFRRYSRRGLDALLREHHFDTLEASHFFSFVMPMALIRRWTGHCDGRVSCEFPAVSKPLNRALLQLGRAELFLLRFVGLPFGTSLFAIAQRS